MEKSIVIKYGVFTALGFWAFFIIASIFGFVHVVELRGLNLFILIGGIWLSLNAERKLENYNFKFSRGLLLGALTGIIAIAIFAVSMCIYLLAFDQALMGSIQANEPFGKYLNPFTIMLVILVEGIASSVIASLSIMQILKAKNKKQIAIQ